MNYSSAQLRTSEYTPEEWEARRLEARRRAARANSHGSDGGGANLSTSDQELPSGSESLKIAAAYGAAALRTLLESESAGYAMYKLARPASGHWRSLPGSSKGTDQAGNEAYGRTWVNKPKSSGNSVKDYAKSVAALAPAAAVKALSDIPKAGIEGGVEEKLLGKNPNIKKIMGKAGGRFGGGLLGVATLPAFLSGMQDMKSNERSDQKKGMAKVVGAGAIYQGFKGAGEAAGEGSKGILRAAGSRALVNLPASALLAYGASKASKEADTGKKYSKGALYGAAAGALKGGSEAVLRGLTPRQAIAKGVGRASGGALGGLVLTGIMDKLIKRKKQER